MSDKTLGSLIAALRKKHGWTLKELSARVGIPLSTLAKVEADKASLNFDKLVQFTSRLDLKLTNFLSFDVEDAEISRPPVTARRSISTPENTLSIEAPNFVRHVLCADLKNKGLIPGIGIVSFQSIEDAGPLTRHKGEEFVYVLEGSLEVHTEFYSPVVLHKGQSMYLDSTMGHAYVAKDCAQAVMLNVATETVGEQFRQSPAEPVDRS